MAFSVSVPGLEDFVKSHLSRRRYAHSVSTAELAASMCERWGLDETRGRLAGFAHDMCKEFEESELIRLARRDGEEIGGLAEKKPRLLHARAAAVLLRERFAVDDPEVLEAVRLHTFAAPSMGKLARIVYCADKIEPTRSHVDDAFRERAISGSIDEMMIFVIEDTIRWLEEHGKEVAPSTKIILEELKGRDS